MSNNLTPELAAVLAPVLAVKTTGERIRNVLLNWDIFSLDDLLDKSETEFLRMPNFGRKSLEALQACLAQQGLHLNGSIIGMNDQSLLDSMRCRADAAMQTAVMMREAVDRLEAALNAKKKEA